MSKDILYDMRLIPTEHLEVYLLHLFVHNMADSSIQTAMIQEFACRATDKQKKIIVKKTSKKSKGKKIPHEYQQLLHSGERSDAIILANHQLASSILRQITEAHSPELGNRMSSLHKMRNPEQKAKIIAQQRWDD